MRIIVIALVVASAGAAGAQTVETERAPEQVVELEWVGVRPLSEVHLDWAVFARAGGGVDGEQAAGIASVAGELALAGPAGCRYVVVGGMVHASRAEGTEVVSGENWASLCISHAHGPDVVGVNLDVSHRLQWELRPTLSARRLAWRRPITRETARLDFNIGGDDGETGARGEIMPIAVVVDWMKQDDAGAGRDALTLGFEFVAARCGPLGKKCITDKIPAAAMELLGLYVYVTPGDVDALVAGHSFGKITGLRLGRGLALDLDLRYGVGMISEAGAEPMDEAVTHAEAWAPVGSVALHGPWWSVKLEQLLYPTFDSELALDDRLTVEARVADIDLSAFAARTALYRLGEDVTDWTAGAAARRDFRLARGVSLSLIAEAGRSFYATLAEDARPTPQVAIRGFALISVGISSQGPAYLHR